MGSVFNYVADLGGLIPPRVRLGRDTRAPANSDSTGASKMDPSAQEKRLSLRMAEGRGKMDVHPWPPRGGHGEVPVVDAQKGKCPEDSPSSWTSCGRGWKSGK